MITDREEILTQIHHILALHHHLPLVPSTLHLQLSTSETQEQFRLYATAIEQLTQVLQVQLGNRQHRNQYTNAYKVLYTLGDAGYIPQIFDSAQEASPSIYVNSDLYLFSQNTLNFANQLVQAHDSLLQTLRIVRLQDKNSLSSNQLSSIAKKLKEFDRKWLQYQKEYIMELIQIEKLAKSKILKIVQAQQRLTDQENDQRRKGKIFFCGQKYHSLRRSLCQMISKLNSIANCDGKGRDDLTYDILQAAQNILATIAPSQSKSIRIIASKIRQSFETVRQILKYFGECMEMVDPQLRNNPELVASLLEYQNYWEKGKRYFLEIKKESQIVACEEIVSAAKEKYDCFREMLEYSDPSIFWIIASLIVLRSLEGEDQGLAEEFLQQISPTKHVEYVNLLSRYSLYKSSFPPNHAYNKLQQKLIEGANSKNQNEEIQRLACKIKQMGVQVERSKPWEWNEMLGVLLLEENQ